MTMDFQIAQLCVCASVIGLASSVFPCVSRCFMFCFPLYLNFQNLLVSLSVPGIRIVL